MTNRKAKKTINTEWQAHVDELLDEALQETFPASDPVSIETDFLLINSFEHYRAASQESTDEEKGHEAEI